MSYFSNLMEEDYREHGIRYLNKFCEIRLTFSFVSSKEGPSHVMLI